MIQEKSFTRIRLIFYSIIWFGILYALQYLAFYPIISSHENLWLDCALASFLLFVAMDLNYFLQSYIPHLFNKFLTKSSFIVLVIGIIFWGQYIALPYIYGVDSGLIFFEKTAYIRLLIIITQVIFFSLFFWLVEESKRALLKNKKEQEMENMLRNAELLKLRQQLQPHFLFNSLNSINSLVVTEPKQAREMILNLSDFLRGTLKEDENKLVTLQEEINLLQLYLDIEKVRFGHRLNINLAISEETKNALIPPLLLQPVVENAIKFGLYNTLENVTISIETKMNNKLLEVVITNPYQDEFSNDNKKGSGFGLVSIQRRLQLLFHRNDLLQTKRSNNIFETRILIPQV